MFIFFKRNDGYKYLPFKSYNELYVTDSSLFLKDIQFNNDTLNLYFSPGLKATYYNLSIDNSARQKRVTHMGNSLHIPIIKNAHVYKLIPSTDGLGVTIQVDHSGNNTLGYTNEFLYCNLPGPLIKLSSYNLWTKGIASYTADEVSKGIFFLLNNTKAISAITDSARLMEVCGLISLLRPNLNGIKASEISLQSPYKQLQMAMQHKINLDCGNYSVMVQYLCSLLKLPNRVVTFSGPAGNWQYGVHYYNEVYLREKQQWVLCDGLSNAYMPYDSVRFYNAADLNKMAHVNSFSNKYAYTFKGKNLIKTSYDRLCYWHRYYNRNNANLCYLHPGSSVQDGKWNYLKDFYSFNRNYYFYSDENENDWLRIMVKMIAFYSFVIGTIAYVLWEIKSFRKASVKGITTP